jgi:hypothetical protein
MQVFNCVIQYRVYEPNWFLYLRIALHYWKHMSSCYRVFQVIAKSGLAFVLRSGAISSAMAIEMMEEVRAAGKHHEAPDTVVTCCTLDFDQAMISQETSGVDHFAEQFEEQLMFNELTTQDPKTSF